VEVFSDASRFGWLISGELLQPDCYFTFLYFEVWSSKYTIGFRTSLKPQTLAIGWFDLTGDFYGQLEPSISGVALDVLLDV
jgi:hypothetical protein